jgi:hypothetical protein
MSAARTVQAGEASHAQVLPEVDSVQGVALAKDQQNGNVRHLLTPPVWKGMITASLLFQNRRWLAERRGYLPPMADVRS